MTTETDASDAPLTMTDLIGYCVLLERGLRHQASKVKLLHGILQIEKEEHAKTQALLDLTLDYQPELTIDTRHGRALLRKDQT